MQPDKLVFIEGREPIERNCSFCRETKKTQLIRIRDDRGGMVIGFTLCKRCLKNLALSACAAVFDFDDSPQA